MTQLPLLTRKKILSIIFQMILRSSNPPSALVSNIFMNFLPARQSIFYQIQLPRPATAIQRVSGIKSSRLFDFLQISIFTRLARRRIKLKSAQKNLAGEQLKNVSEESESKLFFFIPLLMEFVCGTQN